MDRAGPCAFHRYNHVAYTFDLGNLSEAYVDISQRSVDLNHLKPGRISWPRNVPAESWRPIRRATNFHTVLQGAIPRSKVFRRFICSWMSIPNRTSSILQGPSIQGSKKRNKLINQQIHRGWFWPLLPSHSLWFLCRLAYLTTDTSLASAEYLAEVEALGNLILRRIGFAFNLQRKTSNAITQLIGESGQLWRIDLSKLKVFDFIPFTSTSTIVVSRRENAARNRPTREQTRVNSGHFRKILEYFLKLKIFIMSKN